MHKDPSQTLTGIVLEALEHLNIVSHRAPKCAMSYGVVQVAEHTLGVCSAGPPPSFACGLEHHQVYLWWISTTEYTTVSRAPPVWGCQAQEPVCWENSWALNKDCRVWPPRRRLVWTLTFLLQHRQRLSTAKWVEGGLANQCPNGKYKGEERRFIRAKQLGVDWTTWIIRCWTMVIFYELDSPFPLFLKAMSYRVQRQQIWKDNHSLFFFQAIHMYLFLLCFGLSFLRPSWGGWETVWYWNHNKLMHESICALVLKTFSLAYHKCLV